VGLCYLRPMRHLLFFLLLGLAACQSAPKSTSATLILLNGQFFTADSAGTSPTAIALRDDRIVYLGDDATARTWAGDSTQVIDLQGAFVMPGLIEGHGHFAVLGHSLQNLNLLATRNWAEITDLVAQKTRTAPTGDWIEGRGWHQEKWDTSPGRTVNGYPYHDDVSAVSPEHPVVLFHASGHALFANAKAMQLAGISPETPSPVGGRIVRDAKGALTGVFEENAMGLIERHLSAWKNQRPEAERRAAFDRTVATASAECLRRGITSFEDAGSDWWEVQQYERLARAGQLPLRLWAMILQPKPSELGRLGDFPKIGIGNQHFTVRAVKAYFDGALGSYGAWLLAPYADNPDLEGQNTTPLDSIRQLAEACQARGLQFCVHAIGDRANREVLNVFEQTMNSKADLRWRVEHAQHVDPADQPRFRQLGVIASMQAIHCTSDAPFVVKRLGEERARTGAFPWRRLLDQGAALANGTDTPVEDVNPLPCLYASVTRKAATGSFPAFFAEQCMTREEALRSYTIWNAYAAFEEKEKGSLAVGKLADVTVLDKNLLTCAPDDILQAQVLWTIVGGKVRYRR
jgi:predicted amidohydrolase YtcJ